MVHECSEVEVRAGTGTTVELRSFPYPYRAMLAICSDLDETPDRECYGRIVRFLNTTEDTGEMGPGVGLEVGNTIYFDMPEDQFAYWNTDDAGRALARALMRSGHVDCIHSFGDLAVTRAHAGRALDELERHGLRPRVWVDHAVAPSNFGADIMRGRGDLPGSDVYHADLTCGFGVEYVWRGRITSVIGQDRPRSLRAIFERRHPVRSARTVAKEAAKGALARAGSVKYAMHGPNALLREVRLRDGRPVIEFLRSNPYAGGVENAATADGLALALTRPFLDRLVQRGGAAILYTHLGKVRRKDAPFGEKTRGALRLLAEAERAGKVLVTTTRRILDYRRTTREVAIAARREGPCLEISLTAPEVLVSQDGGQPSRIAGLTVYVPDPARTEMTLNGVFLARLDRNAPDHTGRASVSLPWPRLELPRW